MSNELLTIVAKVFQGVQISSLAIRGIRLKADDLSGIPLTSLLVIRNISRNVGSSGTEMFAGYVNELVGLWTVEKYSKIVGSILENL
jgi:hypothetical protein